MSLTFAGARVTVETGTAMREQARVRMLSERRSGRTYSRPTEDPQRSGRTRHLSFTASSDVVGWGSVCVWDVIEDDVPPMPQKPPGKGGWDTTTTTTRYRFRWASSLSDAELRTARCGPWCGQSLSVRSAYGNMERNACMQVGRLAAGKPSPSYTATEQKRLPRAPRASPRCGVCGALLLLLGPGTEDRS